MYILGWTEAMITQAILEQAAENGDMTRAGIVAAANEVEVDFDGLAPDQTWAGEPNDFIVRESYIYDVTLDAVQPDPARRGRGQHRMGAARGSVHQRPRRGVRVRRPLLRRADPNHWTG